MGTRDRPAGGTLSFDDAMIALGRPGGEASQHRLETHPLVEALREAGTAHLYADTADVEELGALLETGDGRILAGIDGNTANQPLVAKVARRYLEAGNPASWAKELRRHRSDLSDRELLPLLYAILCGRLGNEIARSYASGRTWEVSLQLHMSLGRQADAARRVGEWIRAMSSLALVKVPFLPDAPECLIAARELERRGTPVNFTSTFSARQAVVATLFADVTRTNVFMGRLNQGLHAELLGEHVCLAAQRALHRLRREDGVSTRLIVASMREWQAFPRLAGCDVFTAPCSVLSDWLSQKDLPPGEVESQLEASLEDELRIDPEVEKRLGRERIDRLHRVEPELVEFLRELRQSGERNELRDGERLFRCFDEAGFGDLFHAPSDDERRDLRRGKLPDLESPLTSRLALDTLYTLLADADFDKHQEEIDREIAQHLE